MHVVAKKTASIVDRIESLVVSAGLDATNLATFKTRESWGNFAHATAALALVEAFMETPSARLYFEHRVPHSTRRPADILLISEETGLVVVEVKGFHIENIENVSGSVIKGTFYGKSGKEIDVFDQAEQCMFQFKDSYARVARERGLHIGVPQLSPFVFFPFITERDWKGRGYHKCMSNDQILFAEHCEMPKSLRVKVLSHIAQDSWTRKAGKRLTEDQRNILLAALGESSKIFEPGLQERVSELRQKMPEIEINRSNLEKFEHIQRKTEEMQRQLELLKGERERDQKQVEKERKARQAAVNRVRDLEKALEAKKQTKRLDLEEIESRKLVQDLKDEKVRLQMTENKVRRFEEEKRGLLTNVSMLESKLNEVEKALMQAQNVPLEVEESSLGRKVLAYYETEKDLTQEQQEIINAPLASSPFLIRGVAGSGKSIVLVKHVVKRVTEAYKSYEGSLKFARPMRIGVVCFNRSLVPFLKETIAGSLKPWCHKEENPWDVASEYVTCHHLNGLMYHLKQEGFFNYKPVSKGHGAGTDYRYYQEEIRKLKATQPDRYDEMLFDTIYVDESQDLSPEGFQLLLEILRPNKNDEKNLILFYDDAQNLYGRKRPVWKELGIRLDVGRRSRFLGTCYRNTRQTLDFAFNMLMGTETSRTNETVNMAQFADVANLKQRGLIQESNGLYSVNFSERTGEPVEVGCFRSRNDEKRWVYNKVRELIGKENILPEDILILYPKSAIYQDLENAFEKSTELKGVLRLHGDDKDKFPFSSGSLTLSTIHSAKGLGAPVVFLIGVDECSCDARGRAGFYVGATRAKVKLFVTGINVPNSMIYEAWKVQKALDEEKGS